MKNYPKPKDTWFAEFEFREGTRAYLRRHQNFISAEEALEINKWMWHYYNWRKKFDKKQLKRKINEKLS